MPRRQTLGSADLTTPADDVDRYRPVSPLAIVALILGLASALALAARGLWILWSVPVAGAVVAVFALRAIAASEGALIGRKAALGALALSFFFGCLAVSRHVTHQALLREDAKALAWLWFDALAADQPQIAHQWTLRCAQRQPPGASLWKHYRTSQDDYLNLRYFVDDALIHALLALGEKATINYWATEATARGRLGEERISQIYSVSYQDEHGETTSYYVRLVLERTTPTISEHPCWRVSSYEGGVRPFQRTE